MKLTPQERRERYEAFRRMKPGEKADYIFTYFKLPLVLLLIAGVALGSLLLRAVTYKDPVLYLAYGNLAVGEEMNTRFTLGYLAYAGADIRHQQVYVYPGLYLSEDPAAENHEYSYASRLKTLAAINAKQMDVVLMNREAYDILSASGYLLDLGAALRDQDPDALERLSPHLRENTVILEDNATEYRLREAESYQAETELVNNALDISSFPALEQGGFSGSVYLGVIANTPRLSQAIEYAEYLLLG